METSSGRFKLEVFYSSYISMIVEDLIKLEYKLQKEYNEVLKQEELLWYNKSCEKWVKFGDLNTKLFRAQIIVL